MATTLFRNIQQNCEQPHAYDVPTFLSKIGIYLSVLQPFINSIRKPIVSTPETEAYISHTILYVLQKGFKTESCHEKIFAFILRDVTLPRSI